MIKLIKKQGSKRKCRKVGKLEKQYLNFSTTTDSNGITEGTKPTLWIKLHSKSCDIWLEVVFGLLLAVVSYRNGHAGFVVYNYIQFF